MPPPSDMRRDGDYWDGIGADWRDRDPQRLWREHTDSHQSGLIDRWLVTRPIDGVASTSPCSRSLLKTDLFDEVAGRGLAGRLQLAGFDVTGIDISPVVVAEATRRNAGLKGVVADVRSLPFADDSFDAIFSGSTLDHFESPADILVSLGELRRVLRPGGTLLLTMDNPLNPLVRLRNGPLLGILHRVGIVPYQVGSTLGPRPLMTALQTAGFDVAEATAVLHSPRVLAVPLARVADRLGPRSRKWFLRCLEVWERLESLPTRWLTGHYVAVRATRRPLTS